MRNQTVVVIISFLGALILVGVVGAFLLRNPKPEPVAAPVVPAKVAPAHVEKKIGSSVEGRAINATTYGTGKTRVLFVGGMHGGYEWNSVLLAYEYMDYLAAHPEQVPKDMSITVIPMVNPDGVFKIIGKEGRFAMGDVPTTSDHSAGRFNAHGVDLNRNFDCKWQATSTWKNKKVSAGTSAFSEPESQAIRDLVQSAHPSAVVFWHSQANAVYASECNDGVLPETRRIMTAYAKAAGYPSVDSFDAYPVTGDAEGWLASINIPAITVELKTHETIEWEKNLAGIKALVAHIDETSGLTP